MREPDQRTPRPCLYVNMDGIRSVLSENNLLEVKQAREPSAPVNG